MFTVRGAVTEQYSIFGTALYFGEFKRNCSITSIKHKQKRRQQKHSCNILTKNDLDEGFTWFV